MPAESTATYEEVRAAIEAFSDADLLRLEKFARYRVKGLGRMALGRDHHDLLEDAIADTLDPTKRRWNKAVSFVRHMLGAMRSISSHWREQFDPDEARLETDLARPVEGTSYQRPLDLVSSEDPGADQIVSARRQIEAIEAAVAGDTVLRDILGGMRAEMSPSEIREALGLSTVEYDTAMKRFRRHVRPSAGLGEK